MSSVVPTPFVRCNDPNAFVSIMKRFMTRGCEHIRPSQYNYSGIFKRNLTWCGRLVTNRSSTTPEI